MLKATPEDFIVEEQLGYQPIGEGEHIYLWVEKRGLNTAYVAEQLAKFTGLPLRAITYAGRKDKHALTYQWFGVHLPGKSSPEWEKFALEGARILKAERHNKKLRTGVLKGNRFSLTLKDVSQGDAIAARIALIEQYGVPNYYGAQRFGDSRHHAQGGNLALAEKMLEGEEIRNRNKRSMAISALRSWVFNEFVSARVAAGTFDTALAGDALMLSGSNSFFICEQPDNEIAARLQSKDIHPSAPLWGKGSLDSEQDAQRWELSQAKRLDRYCQALAMLGLKQERRPTRLAPTDLQWQLDEQELRIQFSLPAGAFATSVLRELLQTTQE